MSDVGVSVLDKPSPKHLVICVDRVQFDRFFKRKSATHNAVTRTDVTATNKAICLDYSCGWNNWTEFLCCRMLTSASFGTCGDEEF